MKANVTIASRYNECGPVKYEGSAFRVVWKCQLGLMEAYKEAGRLSPWPIAIQPKENQTFYRELFGFLEEEIIEASVEAHELIEQALVNNKVEIGNKLIALNEEIADSLHFWIELFIYLGYDEIDLKNYYASLAHQHRLNSEVGDIFKLAFQFAENWARANGVLHPTSQTGHASSFIFSHAPQPYAAAGNIISMELLDQYEKYTFKTIQNLQLAKNCLKSKYWKMQEYAVNNERFNELILESWLNWVLSISILDIRPAALVQNYLQKNQINHEKIKTA